MALVDEVKDELAAITDGAASIKKAQASAMIRFGGGLRTFQKHIVVITQFSNLQAARWLQNTVKTVYGHETELVQTTRDLPRGTVNWYAVRVFHDGGALALQSGMLDRRRRPVRGLPEEVVQGNIAQVKAAWRGAFLSRGVLSEPGRPPYLEIVCPGIEAAEALIYMARRLGISVSKRKVMSSLRVTLRDSDVIERMLILMGAAGTAREWSGKRSESEIRGKANRLANFDDANMRRSAKAAVEASEKVIHAFEVLGNDIPENLRAAGQLRLDHREASLEELGRLADPPITKDAIAGRIRRLLQLSAKVEKQRASADQD